MPTATVWRRCLLQRLPRGRDILPPDSASAAPHALGIEHWPKRPARARRAGRSRAPFRPSAPAIGWMHDVARHGRDGVVVERGDILCCTPASRTARCSVQPDAQNSAIELRVLDGSTSHCCDGYRDSGVAAIAADNYAVEAVPPAAAKPAPRASCRCTITACSSSASRSASCGT